MNTKIMRYLIQESNEDPLWWVLTDTQEGVVCRFREGDFNESQKFTLLKDNSEYDIASLPSVVNAMTEWLRETHYELIFSSPQTIAEKARIETGRQLKEAREAKGWTLRYLAILTGIAFNHIGRVETGRYNVTIDTLAILADALDVKITIG